MAKANKQKAYRLGWMGEALAVGFYLMQGYRLRHWRYRNPMGEIDLIFQRRDLLVALEVKTRRQLPHFEQVSHRQQDRMRRGPHHYLANHPHLAHNSLRCDVLILSLSHRPVWLRNAL